MQNSSPTGPAVVTAGLEAQILNGIQSPERQRCSSSASPRFLYLSNFVGGHRNTRGNVCPRHTIVGAYEEAHKSGVFTMLQKQTKM
jgi:hypothetical protein